MTTNKKYTKEDDALIRHYINKYNFNISQACQMAAAKLGRTPGAVKYRWYNILKPQKSRASFMLFGRKGTVALNCKNLPIGDPRIQQLDTNNKSFKNLWKLKF